MAWDLNVMAPMRLMRAATRACASADGAASQRLQHRGKAPLGRDGRVLRGEGSGFRSPASTDRYAAHGVLINPDLPARLKLRWMAEGGMLDESKEMDGLATREEALDAAGWSPDRRLAETDEIAAAVVFLCSEQAVLHLGSGVERRRRQPSRSSSYRGRHPRSRGGRRRSMPAGAPWWCWSPMHAGPGNPGLVFTERRADLRPHAGEISSPAAAATTARRCSTRRCVRPRRRSAHPRQRRGGRGPAPIGTFVTSYKVHPFVGLIDEGLRFEPNPSEVESVLVASLDDLHAGYDKRRLAAAGSRSAPRPT